MSSITVETLAGAAIAPWIDAVAELRIRVFREFPYLYDGDRAYESQYLQTYTRTERSVLILAREGDQVIGASTGLPMADETADFQRPFIRAGVDTAQVFYCAESVLLPAFRGRGVYKQFFAGREAHARSLGGFRLCTFCGVQRPADHPARPANYQPLDAVWQHFGYQPQPQLMTEYRWKDIGEAQQTAKPMMFWLKTL